MYLHVCVCACACQVTAFAYSVRNSGIRRPGTYDVPWRSFELNQTDGGKIWKDAKRVILPRKTSGKDDETVKHADFTTKKNDDVDVQNLSWLMSIVIEW